LGHFIAGSQTSVILVSANTLHIALGVGCREGRVISESNYLMSTVLLDNQKNVIPNSFPNLNCIKMCVYICL